MCYISGLDLKVLIKHLKGFFVEMIVIYHKYCSDGLVAAYQFYRRYPDAEFYAAIHGNPPPDVVNKEVFIVDFCYAPEILLEMKKVAKSVLVLDHHKSAMEKCGFVEAVLGEVVFAGRQLSLSTVGGTLRASKKISQTVYNTVRIELKDEFSLSDVQLDMAETVMFDMGRSGAGMAYDYLNPSTKRPWLVDYTEDKDLWRFKLPYSREVNAALQSYPLTFETLDHLSKRDLIELRKEGETILRANQNIIDGIVNKAREVEIQGHKVLSVNSPVLQSEIGNHLCQSKPFAAVWFENELGERVYSLRSDANGVDVSVIAAEYGGGGHVAAAGFRLPPGKEP